ncbi:MAG: ABC transporter ATP-binding protein [Anaerolineales bacterium]|nr:ABC transporter ATP-binding protein [Anaerolineales bacterium]
MHTGSKPASAPPEAPGSPAAIRFEDVAVRYRVPHERMSGIKEYTIRFLQRRLVYEEYWALNGVSFDVPRGQAFGVVGRNGAGKSTMLKVMARVLSPTRGRVVMAGSIAPLLELGAGFHYELTGRENVFLNSALLGRPAGLTLELLPWIIDFAEISDFIDAPIRTYSTGMTARLAFSVAACVQPDILLVDEVLSVGDTRFQEKCVDHMQGFIENGTTIVFVSHSMPTVRRFCQRAMWIDEGSIRAIGDVEDVVAQYTD